MLVRQIHVFTDTGHDDASPLLLRLLHHDFAHDAGVVVVEVTDRLICKNEIERLAEGTHHRYTLLLTERHLPYLGIHLVGDTKHIKPLQDLLATLETGNLVLDLYILHRRKFREETEFLKEMADVTLAHLYPVFHLIVGGNIIVEHHASAVVVTIAEHIAAESTLSAATLCLDKIKMTFLEGNILLPYLRIKVVALGEDLRENGMKLNLFHFVLLFNVLSFFPLKLGLGGTSDGIARNGGSRGISFFYLFTLLPFYPFTLLPFYL